MTRPTDAHSEGSKEIEAWNALKACDYCYSAGPWSSCFHYTEFLKAAQSARPAIAEADQRDAVLEEAARICDDAANYFREFVMGKRAAEESAAAIRALKRQSATLQQCEFPDCGCAEARLCQAGNPNEGALSLNRPRKPATKSGSEREGQ